MAVSPSSVTQNSVTATITLSGSTVTVSVSSTSLYWRVRGRTSDGDSTHYITETRDSSATFSATDGKTYMFQVCSSSGTWSNGAGFKVVFDYKLTISQGTGTKITVKRNGTTLSNGATLYKGDSLSITISANAGYDISSRSHNDGTITVSGNVKVSATATKKTYKLSISQGTGTTISVKRGSTTLSNGATISYGDSLTIAISVNEGYDFKTRSHDDGTYTVDGNVNVYATATVKSFKLSMNAGKGSSITVVRTNSPKANAETGDLSNGATIYYSDVLKISALADLSYEIEMLTVNGSTFTSGNSHTVVGAVSVFTLTEQLGLAFINDEAYIIFIDEETEWVQCLPQVDNGMDWDLCS